MANCFIATLLACALLAPVAESLRGNKTTGAKFVPALVPPSDRTFFGKDYPHDLQPDLRKVAKDFTHPYPEMQDDNTYDKDYVKDENSDNGEWSAQNDYDHLRTKVERTKQERDRSQQYRNELQKKIADAREAARKAGADVSADNDKVTELEKKEKAEEEAKAKAKAAEDALKNAEGEEKKNAKVADGSVVGEEDSSEVDADSKKVEKELTDIEKCKKDLEDAQAKLKALQEERIAAEKADQLANANEADKLSAEELAKKKEDALAEELKAAQDAYDAAQAKAKAEADALARMKSDMGKAEDNLHSLRRTQVDSGGGVYRSKPEQRSATFRTGIAPVTGILTVFVFFAC